MRATWEDRLNEIDRVILIRAQQGAELTQDDKDYIIQLSEFAKMAVQTEMIKE